MSLTDGAEIIKAIIAQMPQSSGIYRMIGEDGHPLYIGKAKNLPKRVTSYTQVDKLPYRLQRMVSLTKTMDFTITASEAEALLLEANLVHKLQPKFNIDLKDDKSFPYILLTGDKEYDMMIKYRGKKEAKGSYFGPFANAGVVTQTLGVLQKAFPLRTCSDHMLANRSRPCIEFEIKRCTAPCVGKISQPEYEQIAADAKAFLKGRRADVQQKLSYQMEEFSARMEYEKAAGVRDRIAALTKIQNENKVSFSGIDDADVIGLVKEGVNTCIQVFFVRGGQNFGNKPYFPRHMEDASEAEILSGFIGQFYQTNEPPKRIILSHAVEDAEVIEEVFKTKIDIKQFDVVQLNAADALKRKQAESASWHKLLKMFGERFGLPSAPKRVEIYDNSHIQGSAAIGAMVVAGAEGFEKKHYRKFNMRHAQTNDDYAMMAEMLTRRFSGKDVVLPEVALIDGGKGQLSAATKALADLGVTGVLLIGIAKGPDRNAGLEDYYINGHEPFKLEEASELAFFVQRLRDEAHRYAISSHRAKRDREIKKSQLDEIAGVGAVRKKALLGHFGSVGAIKLASVDELTKAHGINRQVAQIIYNYFH